MKPQKLQTFAKSAEGLPVCGFLYLGSNSFAFVSHKDKQWRLHEEPYNLNNPLTRYYLSQFFTRFVYPSLKSCERIVMEFIFDRTVNWGKETERIKKEHFISGIPDYSSGTGLSTPTINKAIANLTESGLVRCLGGKVYGINFNRIEGWLQEKGSGMVFREPKKPKETLDSGVQKPKETLYITEDNKLSKREEILSRSSSSTRSISEIKNSLTQQAVQKQERVKERLTQQYKNNKTITPSNLEKLWWMCYEDTQPANAIKVNWTRKNFGQVKHFINNVKLPSGYTAHDFMTFVITYWKAIQSNHFEYINQHRIEQGQAPIAFPQAPEIGFVMGWKQVFINAYSKHLGGTLTPRQREATQLLSLGYDQEQVAEIQSAQRDIEKRQEAVREKESRLDKNEQLRDQIEAMRAKQKQASVHKMQEYKERHELPAVVLPAEPLATDLELQVQQIKDAGCVMDSNIIEGAIKILGFTKALQSLT